MALADAWLPALLFAHFPLLAGLMHARLMPNGTLQFPHCVLFASGTALAALWQGCSCVPAGADFSSNTHANRN
jgi:hypothetical protein